MKKKKQHDVRVSRAHPMSAIYLFEACTLRARVWFAKNVRDALVSESGDTFYVDHRCAEDLLMGLQNDGLTLTRG